MRNSRNTRPFRGLQSDPVSGSIAENMYVRLGGFEQWVMLRGESLTNPVVSENSIALQRRHLANVLLPKNPSPSL